MLNRSTPEEGIPIKEYIRMKYGAAMAESSKLIISAHLLVLPPKNIRLFSVNCTWSFVLL
jgi:hypothetical protein